MKQNEQTLLSGRTAYVAGGSSGINLAIVERFAKAGANVAIVSRSGDRVRAAVEKITSRGGSAMGLSADVRDYDAVEASIRQTHDQFGAVDIVVSGAAGNFLAPVVGMSSNAFRTVVDIDLIGTFNVFRASFDYLRKPGASLIAITAPQAVNPQPLQTHACAAKAGVNMLTRCLAMEWGPMGVRVNAISPGPIAGTEGMQRLAENLAGAAAIKARVPLRDFGRKDDIAEMALFLVSESSSYVTGSIMNCDGGSSLGDASADCSLPQRSV